MEFFNEHGRSNWIQINTLVWLRWCAIAGQIAAIAAATALFDVHVALGPVALAIGALSLVNMLWHALSPRLARLDERQAPLFLLFDVVQLGVLLALTGGLSNPFAMLLLAPVTIGASVLPFRWALAGAGLAVALVLTMAAAYLPLRDAGGAAMEMPPIFRFGHGASLVIGVVFLGFYARRVTTDMHTMRDALMATQFALNREQKLTDLGGVVAATAHELGTPLATITLVSSELSDLLEDSPELREDAQLIRTQADRCRDILRSMGRAGKEDRLVRDIPIEALVARAAEPHQERGVRVEITTEGSGLAQPVVPNRPEILHGLRNLVQNAVDFAQDRVEIQVTWNNDTLRVRVRDDGPGYPVHLIRRLGDPMIRRRRSPQRPAYEGMGLGLFIAKTLLERTGAKLQFANGSGARQGAVAEVAWRIKDLAPDPGRQRRPLGENTALTPD